MRRSLRAGMLALAGLTWLGAGAQALRDPTQPPPLASSAPPGTASPSVPGEPQLQSVLISSRPDGRRVAVIDGQTYRVGDKFRDAVVVKITATKVQLKQGKVVQELVLGPVSTARGEAPKAEADKTEPAKPDPAKAAGFRMEELLEKARSK